MADQDLEKFDTAFATAGSGAGTRDNVPDGEYKAAIERLEKRTWRDKPQVSWRFTIIGPSSAGRKLFRDVEVNAENLGRIWQDVRNVGLDLRVDPAKEESEANPMKLSLLPERASQVVGKEVTLTVKTNAKGYTNTYIDGLAAPF